MLATNGYEHTANFSKNEDNRKRRNNRKKNKLAKKARIKNRKKR